MPFKTAVWQTAAAILGANDQRLEEGRVRDSCKALVPLVVASFVVENIIMLAVAFQFWKS